VERGPITATEVAGDLPMSRQAVAKHLQILGEAGLVHGERVGRETRFEASTEPLHAVTDWIDQTDRAWSVRLGRLEEQVRRATGR
jgi:DNA-binding transcriptional ArsR family regulator